MPIHSKRQLINELAFISHMVCVGGESNTIINYLQDMAKRIAACGVRPYECGVAAHAFAVANGLA